MDEFDRQVFALRASRHALYVFSVMVWGWGFFFMNSFSGIPAALVFLLPLVGALPLLFLSARFARRLGGLGGPAPFANKRMLWFYLGVVALTVIGYVVILLILLALHHYLYVTPVATVLVGLHFLALIPIFRGESWRYYLTTIAFCFAGLLPVFIVPLDFMLGSLHVISGWQLVTSPICWLWLWGLSVYLLVRGRSLLRQVRTGEAAQTAAVGT